MAENSKVLETAKYLREHTTKAEKILWDRLRNNKLGIKFRRQMPLDLGEGYHYIPDFYCSKKKLIIELDGNIHDNKENQEYDKKREDILEECGYKIIRFTNEQIINKCKDVINEIKEYIAE